MRLFIRTQTVTVLVEMGKRELAILACLAGAIAVYAQG